MKFRLFAILFLALGAVGCKSLLEEEAFSQLDPNKVFNTQTGIERVLFNAYDYASIHGNFGGNIQFQEEWFCDQFWETGGAVNQQYMPMSNFSFDASYPTHWANLWTNFYRSIRDCNLVLENIDNSSIDEKTKALIIAEARFVRASVYYKAHLLWGPVILRTNTTDPTDMARCSEEEMVKFIEDEFLAVEPLLPQKGELSGYQYGRATRGAADAYLCKFYLQEKRWADAVTYADKIINAKSNGANIYELWPDYTTLFTVDNEQVNKEFIWAYTCYASASTDGNEMMNGAFPADFHHTTDGKIVFLSNMRNWARMDRIWDSYYNTYDPADKRLGLFVTEYYNSKGVLVDLKGKNNIRLFKYTPDINAVGNAHGNDIPVFRLADIILAKAEALNELNGPNQESLDLIQQVRNRAGLTTPLNLADYTKETLRKRILDERGWELIGENHRREDLIRHGTLLEVAKDRVLNNNKYGQEVANKIDSHFLVYPIPYNEVDSNSLCEQNEGYD